MRIQILFFSTPLYLAHSPLLWPIFKPLQPHQGAPWWFSGKESLASVGDTGSIFGSGNSLGKRNGNPHQYFCLGNPMDREAWWAIVYGVSKSWTPIQPPIHQFFNRSVLSVLCASYLWYVNQQLVERREHQGFFLLDTLEENSRYLGSIV